ncbi:MAG: response regulator transcription factor [Eubacterium sp.]|nr:response regulator transcription factor [Eubacterium sp.]
MLIKVAIVEDDENCTACLQELLVRYAQECGETFHVDMFSSGIDFISDYTAEYDLIFMDIDMPLMNGYKTAKVLRKVDSEVALIFVTNLAKYAIKGYEVNACDFIIKPVEYNSFSVKLKKAIARLEKNKEDYLTVTSRNGILKVYYSEIYYITVFQRYVMLHTKKGPIEMHTSMKELEGKFKDTTFIRGDNSSMVNLMYVTAVNQEGAIVNGQLIPCSRNRRKALLDAFTLYVR